VVAFGLASARSPARGQETELPLVPAGKLRLSVQPSFQSWSSRFGTNGAEALGGSLTDATGVRLFPGIATLEAGLRTLLADPGYQARAGNSTATVAFERTRVGLAAEIGVSDRFTVGVAVPLVKARTELDFLFRADSATTNLGVNPALTSAGNVIAFTDELRARSAAATTRANQLCSSAPSSAECASARAVAQNGERLTSGLLAGYAASPFFPLETSAAAAGIRQQMTAFNQGLSQIGLSPLTRTALFAPSRAGEGEITSLLADPIVGLGMGPLENREGGWKLGDVEVHAAMKLLDRVTRPTPMSAQSSSYYVGVGALVRLGTAADAGDVLLSQPVGDGQMDFEGRAFADVQKTSWGLWTDVRLGMQQSGMVVRRVGPADLALIPATNLSTLEWTPGTYIQIEVSPRYRLGEELAVTGAYRLYDKQEDDFVRVSAASTVQNMPPLPSPTTYADVSLLKQGTSETRHEVGFGLVYSSVARWTAGGGGLPMDVRVSFRWGVAGSGAAPRGARAALGIRVYRTLWGGSQAGS
jgi:hypothetical protein